MLDQSIDDIESQHILIVDDDSIMRVLIQTVLTNLGFEHIELAEDGEEAASILQSREVGLVLTDIQMPVMNGLELTQKIRCGELAVNRNLPIIVVTSFSSDDMLKSALALDVNGFLSKPFKPMGVAKQIMQALSESEFSPRSLSAYAAVTTDMKLITSQDDNANETIDIENNKRSVRVYELEPNMCLMEEVRHENGSLLLGVGFIMTSNTINRLKELGNSIKGNNFFIKT